MSKIKEIIKIKIIKPVRNDLPARQSGGSRGDGYSDAGRRNSIKTPSSFKGIFLSVLVGIIFAGLFSFGVYVFANPPASPYAPGETLNPNCAPGTTNCKVVAPVPYTGAIAALNLGSQNFTTTGAITSGTQKLKSDDSNYATLTTTGNGDLTIATTSATTGGNINLNSAVVGDSTILGSSGTLVLGGLGGTNNENLKFDFETYTDKVAVTSATGVTMLDLGSLNLTTTGTLTLGGSTAGTLITRVKTGSPTESDTNGSLVVDSSNGRFYFRYGGAWHYVAQTAGFQIPNFETIDLISGDEIKKGDIVLGMINQAYEDKALHGVWIKWDSVKSELIKEIQAAFPAGGWVSGLPSAPGIVSGVDTTPLVDKVTNIIFSLGINIKNGITNIANLITEKFSAKTARIEKLEMVDKATSDIYCAWIENGDWQKAKGECGSSEMALAVPEVSLSAQATTIEIVNQVKKELKPAIQSQVEFQVKEQVQTEVQQQLEVQQTPLAEKTTQNSEEQTLTPTKQTTSAPPEQAPAPIEQPTIFDVISNTIQSKNNNGAILFTIGATFVLVMLFGILLFIVKRKLQERIIEKLNREIKPGTEKKH